MLSPFAWPGGKRALVHRLLPLFPQHDRYIEVFAGSAKLLFAKPPAAFEVLNDVNGDVTNFFRVAKHRTAELAERFETECIHAGRFRELLNHTNTACELDRAMRFAYLAWYSFGGKGAHFARGSVRSTRVKRPLDTVREILTKTAARLQRVLIEQRDFAEIFDRYDGPGTFFYLDPPYVDYQENNRYAPLSEERRAELYSRLHGLKAQWLMSFENHNEARKAAKRYGFDVACVNVVYTLSGQKVRKPRSELLLANFPLGRNKRSNASREIPVLC
jgi:DNA adenine methylase